VTIRSDRQRGQRSEINKSNCGLDAKPGSESEGTWSRTVIEVY